MGVRKSGDEGCPIGRGMKGIPPGMPGKPSVKKSEDAASPALSRKSIAGARVKKAGYNSANPAEFGGS